jgi:hypothetical protein
MESDMDPDRLAMLKAHALNTIAVIPQHVDARDKLELAVEIERLRLEVTNARSQCVAMADELRRVRDLSAIWERENERLRKVLTEITDQDWVENCLDPQWAARIARAALPPTPASTGREAVTITHTRDFSLSAEAARDIEDMKQANVAAARKATGI